MKTASMIKLVFFAFYTQSCGINNNIKVKNLREEIVSEQRKTQGLMKKRNAELKRLQIVKDSVTRYHELLNITHP
jgi:hypothetical protein